MADLFKFIKNFDTSFGPGNDWEDTDATYYRLMIPNNEHGVTEPVIQVHKQNGSDYTVVHPEYARVNDISSDVEIGVFKSPNGIFAGRVVLL